MKVRIFFRYFVCFLVFGSSHVLSMDSPGPSPSASASQSFPQVLSSGGSEEGAPESEDVCIAGISYSDSGPSPRSGEAPPRRVRFLRTGRARTCKLTEAELLLKSIKQDLKDGIRDLDCLGLDALRYKLSSMQDNIRFEELHYADFDNRYLQGLREQKNELQEKIQAIEAVHQEKVADILRVEEELRKAHEQLYVVTAGEEMSLQGRANLVYMLEEKKADHRDLLREKDALSQDINLVANMGTRSTKKVYPDHSHASEYNEEIQGISLKIERLEGQISDLKSALGYEWVLEAEEEDLEKKILLAEENKEVNTILDSRIELLRRDISLFQNGMRSLQAEADEEKDKILQLEKQLAGICCPSLKKKKIRKIREEIDQCNERLSSLSRGVQSFANEIFTKEIKIADRSDIEYLRTKKRMPKRRRMAAQRNSWRQHFNISAQSDAGAGVGSF